MGGNTGRLVIPEDRQMAVTLIDESITSGARLYQACDILFIHPKTYRSWKSSIDTANYSQDARAEANRNRTYGHALSPEERQRIIDICLSDRFLKLSPEQIVPILADEGIYLASQSTFYRILKEEKLLKGRKKKSQNRAPQPLRTHVANAPNQVWTWDITYIPTHVIGQYYKLYMVLDTFSRAIVGWEIHYHETSEHAATLIQKAVNSHKIHKDQLVLHSDNGSPMKGKTMIAKLDSLGVMSSFSRPGVSNDNAYSESLFGSMKTRNLYPRDGFNSLENAREWVGDFVHWYNEVHRHKGIKYVTPGQRHRQEDKALLESRKLVYQEARLMHPERWKGRNTRNWDRITTVVLNPVKNGDQAYEKNTNLLEEKGKVA